MAINVTRTSANLDKTQQYFLTLAPNVKKMTDKSGEVIAVDAFCIYEDTSVTITTIKGGTKNGFNR